MKKKATLIMTIGFLASGSAAATSIMPWTSTETNYFTYATPDGSDAKVRWVANNLLITYDNFPVNGIVTGGGGSSARFLSDTPGPSLATRIIPIDAIGISFDFSHTGVFNEYAQVAFPYYNPTQEGDLKIIDGILPGSNIWYSTVISPDQRWSQRNNCSDVNTWRPGLLGPCGSDVTETQVNGVQHVDVRFTNDMLRYEDGLAAIIFEVDAYSGPVNVPFAGSASFTNISWLIEEGSSSAVNRWHIPDPTEPSATPDSNVPEPSSIMLVVLGMFAARIIRSKRLM